MKKNNLDVETSVAALFALCHDVSRLTAHGEKFFYLKPKQRQNIKVMKYILKVNGVKSDIHWSHYYTGLSDFKDLVLRVPVYNIAHCSNAEFKDVFESVYMDKYNVLNAQSVGNQSFRFFRLMSGAKKQVLVRELASRTK